MRSCETKTVCEICGEPAEHCEAMLNILEQHYRLRPLCWRHKVARQHDWPDLQMHQLLIDGDIGRLDRDRCGGDCICDECGRKYFDLPQCRTFPFLNVLCDGSVVKF
jgi:hypothetical protein